MSKVLLHSDNNVTALAITDLCPKSNGEKIKEGDIIEHEQIIREVEMFILTYTDYNLVNTVHVVINADIILAAAKKIEELRATTVNTSYKDRMSF